jgi:hypothetical protein
LTDLRNAVTATSGLTGLFAAQLVVFLLVLVRFYWGSFRYYQQEPKLQGNPELAIDFIGAILVFVGFYVTSLLLRTAALFYWAIGLLHIVDFVWFLLASTCLALVDGMRKVATWFLLFDVATCVGLAAVFIIFSPTSPEFKAQWWALGLLVVVSAADLSLLWAFYTGAANWSNRIGVRRNASAS